MASNWGGTLPTNSTLAYITNGGTATVDSVGAVCSFLSLGSPAGSGSVQMTGGNLRCLGSEYVGDSGKGTFAQTGGTNEGNVIYLGNNAGSSGTYNLSGSGVLTATVYVGNLGTGTFTQTGGSNQYGVVDISNNGAYSLSGNGLVSAVLAVGDSGSGTFTQTGGTIGMNSEVYLGLKPGSNGTYSLSGSGLMTPLLGACVGYSGTGTFTQSGGTNNLSLLAPNSFTLGLNAGSSGTYNLSAGLLVLSSLSQGSGAAAFNFSGGTIQTGPPQVWPFALSTSMPMTLGTGGGATFDTPRFEVSLLSGPLSGSGGLTVVDSGTLTLAASNTYTGPTTINQGTLLVNASLASPVTVNSGGTLGGTGNLTSGTVSAGGAIAPGNSLGTLTFSGGLVLASGADLDYDLDLPGTSSMISCSSLTLGGQQFSNFAFPYTANFAPGTYYLIESGSAPGGTLGTSTSGTIDGYSATLFVQGSNLMLNVVPEPGTFALLAAGALGLLGYAWRKRKRDADQMR